MQKIKVWARSLKRQIYILYFAYKDQRVPWYAKIFTICVVAYAFSPIDLIPDFIPILGFLDDVILLPLGIMLALKMIPDVVIEDSKAKVDEMSGTNKPKNWIVGLLIIIIWSVFLLWLAVKGYQLLN